MLLHKGTISEVHVLLNTEASIPKAERGETVLRGSKEQED
jgi:hypothetical protein